MNRSQVGRVVLLVGPSSVGKTSVAAELQRLLPGLWLRAGVDLFWGMLDELTLPERDFRSDSAEMRHITRGWHRAVRALALEGNNMLVDEPPTHRWWLDDWRDALEGLTWRSIGLAAPGPELLRRELQRGDRPEGLALRDLAAMPEPDFFDLFIDTGAVSAGTAASLIAALISQHKGI